MDTSTPLLVLVCIYLSSNLDNRCSPYEKVVPMIGYIYFKGNKGSVPALPGDEIKGSFSIGMIFGQLIFGTLGDALGRQRVYGKECLFTIFGTLLVVLLTWHGLSEKGAVAWLSVFRAITGMGTGGGT